MSLARRVERVARPRPAEVLSALYDSDDELVAVDVPPSPWQPSPAELRALANRYEAELRAAMRVWRTNMRELRLRVQAERGTPSVTLGATTRAQLHEGFTRLAAGGWIAGWTADNVGDQVAMFVRLFDDVTVAEILDDTATLIVGLGQATAADLAAVP